MKNSNILEIATNCLAHYDTVDFTSAYHFCLIEDTNAIKDRVQNILSREGEWSKFENIDELIDHIFDSYETEVET